MWLVSVGIIFQIFNHRDSLDAYTASLDAEKVKYQITYTEE